MVQSWLKYSIVKGIRWSIKVHNRVTHIYRMKIPGALEWFNKLRNTVMPLEEHGLVDFYLFQLPPSYTASSENWNRIIVLAEKLDLGWKMAIEWRHESWFRDEWVDKAREHEITVVSVDSPDFMFYARSGPYVYVRMHGRTFWYSHRYSDEELNEVVKKILDLKGSYIYIFFNNDHDMLDNAKRMYELLSNVFKKKRINYYS